MGTPLWGTTIFQTMAYTHVPANMTKRKQVRKVKQQSVKDLTDKAMWALMDCKGHDEGFGCLV